MFHLYIYICGVFYVSCMKNIANIPILPLFDFEAAFPSVPHRWICWVLEHRKLPQDYMNLFIAIYKHAHAAITHEGRTIFIFNFLSGVLQGCPGSAFLFNNSLDPFLYICHRVLREKRAGILRACADDLGVALRALRFLKLLFPIFQSAQSIAGLILKPSKCNLVVLVQLNDVLHAQIKAWLAANLPSWAGFQVCCTAKYLGFF